jgi:hypothetical protein
MGKMKQLLEQRLDESKYDLLTMLQEIIAEYDKLGTIQPNRFAHTIGSKARQLVEQITKL